MTERREFLRTAAASAAGVAIAGCVDDDGEQAEWIAVASPVEGTLYDVTASQAGPHAVGEDGRVIARRDGDWQVAVATGPTGAANALVGAAASDNGRHVWFAGDSGVVGVYDVDDRKLVDHSAPMEKTSSWEDVAVVGLADAEWVYLVNGSGELVRGSHANGKMEWTEPVEPGSGSSATSVEFTGRGLGFVADTSSNVFQTIDAGESWRRIGVQRGGVNLNDVAPLHTDEIAVVGDDGAVFDYNGFTWTRTDAGEDALLAVVRDSNRGLAVSDAGATFRLTTDGWTRETTTAENPLRGVVLSGTDDPAVAVGDDGTILERHI
ncbi:WD40/YVTN/BNR-like repeat-containing protein [Halomicrococcus sp. SG-WS-1]|uniref:WD40/YVTN/BNR-like repeat-containing protein n=1 Tax=Halomicrococcus sp. SG-WS-1 TaxID=3439057 RepID=UPI003F7A9D5B